ncbi:g3436 [Coccomyxa elongata]
MAAAAILMIKALQAQMLEILSKLGNDSDDSDEEVSVDSEDEVTEWVEGEQDGVHWRVPKEFYEEGERMSYFELLHDVMNMKKELLKILQRNNKAMAAMGRCSAWLDDADDFVLPASFFAAKLE